MSSVSNLQQSGHLLKALVSRRILAMLACWIKRIRPLVLERVSGPIRALSRDSRRLFVGYLLQVELWVRTLKAVGPE